MNPSYPMSHWLARSRFQQIIPGASLALVLTAAPLWGQKTAHVQVNVKSELAVVPAAGYGVGMSVYDNDFTSPGLPDKLKAAGVTALRFPGGSYSDCYHWKTHSETAGTTLYIHPNDTFDNFMTKDVLPAGAEAVITVNYGSNAAGTGGGDPAEAADWVRYANKEKGWKIRYWEIGNEVGGNGFFGPAWEEDLHAPYDNNRKGNPTLSQTAYGKNSLEFIRAMKAVDPTIKIGVAVDYPEYNPGTGNDALMQVLKDKADFVIFHWYPKSGSTDITVTEDIKPLAAALREQIAHNAGEGQRMIPFAITETNGGGSGASRALFATDTYLTWFEAGAFTVVWQEMHDGFLSAVKEVPLDTPSEAYDGMQMASLAARPGDVLVEAQSSSLMLSAHAVRRKDGGMAIVLINKHPTQAFVVDVAIPDLPLAAAGLRYDFGRANFSLNSPWPASGPSQTKIEGLAKTFSVTLAATSECVLLIPAK
ncbi:MAG: hypothetical protein ABSC48_02090 [Terracidiphilus sp.]|jgi:hypothetical protein